jgi:hypothetical protein
MEDVTIRRSLLEKVAQGNISLLKCRLAKTNRTSDLGKNLKDPFSSKKMHLRRLNSV